jgi:quinol monooxygenase YgiN
VVFIEKWRDGDALQAHSSGPIIQGLNEKLKGKVEGRPDFRVLEPVPAGDPTKGQV